MNDTVILYRPVGPEELRLIRESEWRAFPPRLPDQPIFYPVLNQFYAARIARDWNVPASGAGFVTRFRLRREHAAKFPVRTVGSLVHQELWVPAVELPAFNANLVGRIEVIAEFYPDAREPEPAGTLSDAS
ncbi:MAG TPA: ADP-ribosylation/crystallin J1 [Verrucomicrobiae bacterium]|nr:ADP-ribosylation/crystallin J1 [Verrucomicrobiae bacterium]